MSTMATKHWLSLVFKYFVVIPMVTLVLGVLMVCLANGGIESTIAGLLRIARDFNDCGVSGSDLLCVDGTEDGTTINEFANQLKQIVMYFYVASALCGGAAYIVIKRLRSIFLTR